MASPGDACARLVVEEPYEAEIVEMDSIEDSISKKTITRHSL
jgi:hypothetical protein